MPADCKQVAILLQEVGSRASMTPVLIVSNARRALQERQLHLTPVTLGLHGSVHILAATSSQTGMCNGAPVWVQRRLQVFLG